MGVGYCTRTVESVNGHEVTKNGVQMTVRLAVLEIQAGKFSKDLEFFPVVTWKCRNFCENHINGSANEKRVSRYCGVGKVTIGECHSLAHG